MALAKEKVAQIVKEFGKDEKDTGCPEVQVALLTERIKQLTEHLKVHIHYCEVLLLQLYHHLDHSLK